MFETPKFESIDIDTEEDWRRAEILHRVCSESLEDE